MSKTLKNFVTKTREEWNSWARGVLDRKEKLVRAGKWRVTYDYIQYGRMVTISADKSIPEIQNILNEAYADFSGTNINTFTGEPGSGGKWEEHYLDNGKYIIEVTGIDSGSFNGYIFPGDVSFKDTTFEDWTQFDSAKFHGLCDFTRAKFKGVSLFNHAEFYENTEFLETKFLKDTDFLNSRFYEGANFLKCEFHREGNFQYNTFVGRCDYGQSKFIGTSDFSNTNFEGPVCFQKVDFESHSDFSASSFSDVTDFEAILVKRAFSLADAEFTSSIPNFTQANFAESPRLDNIEILPAPIYKDYPFPSEKIQSPLKWQRYWWNLQYRAYLLRLFWRCVYKLTPSNYRKLYHKGEILKHIWNKLTNTRRNPDEEAHYRALKRLAIQAHDHENEMKFFAGEIRARRHVADFMWPGKNGITSSVRYWAGVLYELTSNFGRSLLRPIALWAVLFLLFTNVYHTGADTKALQLCRDNQQKIASSLTPELTTPWSAAATITAKNSLLFISTDRTEKLKRAYTCLYGASPLYNKSYYGQSLITELADQSAKNQKEEMMRLAPNVPSWVSFWGVINSIISLSLTFLFLLAIRNQFKIK